MDAFSLISVALIIGGLAIVYYRKYPLAHSLVLINLVVFMLTILSASWGESSYLPSVERYLGFRPTYVDDIGQYYTVLTSMFAHASLMHVLFNMIFLYLVGVALEERVGRKAFAIFYFATGVAALLMESLFRGFDSTVLILGASGAISGVMGALLYLYPKDEIPMFLGFFLLPRVPVWISVGAWFAIQVVSVMTLTGVSSGGTAYAAHISGFVAGMALAQFIPREGKEKKDAPHTDLSELATTEELKGLWERIHDENEPEVRRAWTEHFVSKAKCPECGGSLRLEGNRIKCACGWEKTVR